MGNRISFLLVGISADNEQKFAYCSSNPCDGLALMLWNKEYNYRTTQKLNEILTPDEIQTIKCTYGKNSESVLDGYESYNPEFDTPNQLQKILDKIKRFYIKKLYTDKSLSEGAFREILYDIVTLSELYSALDIAKSQNLKVILTLEDS